MLLVLEKFGSRIMLYVKINYAKKNYNSRYSENMGVCNLLGVFLFALKKIMHNIANAQYIDQK